MASPADVPRASEPIAAAGGYATKAWVDFFLKLASAESTADLAALYEALARRVAELEERQAFDFKILGQSSVKVDGIPQPGGAVVITLQNDADAPGNSMYYGTGPTGAKGWFALPATFGPPPTDGSPYVGLNGAWERANTASSRFWLIEYPLLTDQAGNQLTDQVGNFLMANSPIVPPGWPTSSTTVAALPLKVTLAEANTLTGVEDGQTVLITDLAGGRELCWYDITAPGSTKWRRYSDRSIAN